MWELQVPPRCVLGICNGGKGNLGKHWLCYVGNLNRTLRPSLHALQPTSAKQMCRRRVVSSAAWGMPSPCLRGRVMIGVLMDEAAVMKSSRSRGMPRVTLASPRPAGQRCEARL